MSTRPTIKDVAQQAGVSPSSVSRVLSDHPYVSDDLRDRVMKVIRELGYTPNRPAQSLRRQQSKIIGILIPDVQNPYYTALIRAVEDVLSAKNYIMVLHNSDEDKDIQKTHLQTLADEKVAGIILAPVAEGDEAVQAVIQEGTAVVTVDRDLLTTEVDNVMLDNGRAVKELVDVFVKNHHVRIGMIAGLPNSTTGRERMEGFCSALSDHGIRVNDNYTLHVFPDEDNGYAAANKLLNLERPPTAIITGNNLLTVGAYKAIHDRNLKIPGDMALAGFDEMRWTSMLNPSLTVIDQPIYEMGRVAADLLLQRIKNPGRSIEKHIFPGTLIVRETSGPHQDKANTD